jgi:hypothetical protein
MARNAAVKLEGNAVSPVGEIRDGKREYGIYRCE